jgi:orotidine-5'-phosphate decarboxylase
MYADAIFEQMGFDACTVSPYMGRDSVEPFLAHRGTCTFVLARTSNPGSADFQELTCDGESLYRRVARAVKSWDADAIGDAGLVVGATDIESLSALREECPAMPFLIPGVGAQGGSAGEVVRAAGGGPMLVNMSRSVLYASPEGDFAEAAARAAEEARESLNARR